MSAVEDASADLNCLVEERGPEFALNRYGLGIDEVEDLMLLVGEDPLRATVLLHGVLLGLALSETRERAT